VSLAFSVRNMSSRRHARDVGVVSRWFFDMQPVRVIGHGLVVALNLKHLMNFWKTIYFYIVQESWLDIVLSKHHRCQWCIEIRWQLFCCGTNIRAEPQLKLNHCVNTSYLHSPPSVNVIQSRIDLASLFTSNSGNNNAQVILKTDKLKSRPK
jgi:hypothetical protein